jgi:signal peptidase II
VFTSLVIISVIVLDQLTKYYAVKYIPEDYSVPVINGVFHLSLVKNTGAAFGIFPEGTVFFLFVSLFAVILILFILKNRSSEDLLLRVSLALVCGGACGNLIDRLRFSYMVDFLDFRIWPVFNIADSCISVGAVLMLYRLFKTRNL